MDARDWRFGGAIETYKDRVGTKGLAEYIAVLERLSRAAKWTTDPIPMPIGIARRRWPEGGVRDGGE